MRLWQLISENKNVDFPEGYELHRDLKNKYESYPSHIKQWVRSEFNKVLNPNHYEASILDAADYYLSKISDNRFQKILTSYTPTPKNILTLTLSDIKKAQSKYDELYDAPSKRSLKKTFKNKHVTELVNDDTLRILKIEKGRAGELVHRDDLENAAAILADMARGTKWCVTSTKMGKDYLKDGPMYLIFDKGANAKFLCHPASKQFMNVLDEPFYIYDDRVFKLLHKHIKDIGFVYQGENPEFMKYNPESAYTLALTMGKRWVEAEKYIARSPEYAYKYANNVIRGRFEEAEDVIIKSEYNTPYAINVLQARWFEAEPFILTGNTGDVIEYAKKFFEGGRWPEAERLILGSVSYIVDYCAHIGRWPEAERVLLDRDNLLNKHYLSIRLFWLRMYAMQVVKGRWPEAEPIFNLSKHNPNTEKYYAWVSDL